ncbi:6,7-dimethyl-8-ribityllumazine synthase [Candidatus Nomurabacteria bacterium]|nr:6,7-dimethyl-8-ribityllumazine synthase [Candidatus Nomurabacteria bacterium]
MQTKNKQKNITATYLDGSKLKACVVLTRWNSEITDGLLVSALLALKKCKLSDKNIKIVHVSGAVELPFALHKMAKKYDFMVALGCVIRGDTPHFDYVCKMAQEGILKVMLEDNIPVGFGVLSVNNLKQAKVRLHVGGEAALAALGLALL